MTVLRMTLIAGLLALPGCQKEDNQTTQTRREPPIRLASAVKRGEVRAAPTAQQGTQRRMWAPAERDQVYDVSPDGRLAGYIDWRTGNLWVRDLTNGTSRNLTNKGSYDQTLDEAESALFSPDGSQLAYEWWEVKDRHEEVRVIATDGTGVRTLLSVPPKTVVWPATWTPDAKYIVTYITHPDRTRELVMVSTSGGAHRSIMKLQGRRVEGLRVSPDGRYMVYSVAQGNDVSKRDIHIMNLQNLRESVLLRNPAYSLPIGWTRDGRLVFTSERGGTPGVWAVRVLDGRAQGEPQLIRGDLWRTDGLTLTTDGRLFYFVHAGDRDVFTTAFDPATGRVQSQPLSVTGSPGELYALPTWSPDGKYVAYLTGTPGRSVRFGTITLRSIEGDEVRKLHPGVEGLRSFVWLPDGQTMMLYGADERGRRTLFRFDLKTGTTRPEVAWESPRNWPEIAAFSKDSRYMYYAPRAANADSTVPWRVVARDLTTGRERDVLVAPRDTWPIAVFAIVEDGRTALVQTAFRSGPLGLLAVSIENGSVRDLGRNVPLVTGDMMRPIGVTSDGKNVLVTVIKSGQGFWSQLWSIPLGGDPAVRLADPPNIRHGGQTPGSWLSPDGRRILYWSGTLSTELWMLDDPKLATR